MGYHVDRSLRSQKHYTEIARSIYSHARHFHSTLDAMLDERERRIFADQEFKGAPQWVKSYVSGVWDTLRAALFAHDLVWCHVLDGKLVPSSAVGNRISEVNSDLSRHCWKGTTIVFFEPKSPERAA